MTAESIIDCIAMLYFRYQNGASISPLNPTPTHFLPCIPLSAADAHAGWLISAIFSKGFLDLFATVVWNPFRGPQYLCRHSVFTIPSSHLHRVTQHH
jgi:hypothetical protein